MNKYEAGVQKVKEAGLYNYNPELDDTDYEKALRDVFADLLDYKGESWMKREFYPIIKPAFENIDSNIEEFSSMTLPNNEWKKLFFDCYIHVANAYKKASEPDMFDDYDNQDERAMNSAFFSEYMTFPNMEPLYSYVPDEHFEDVRKYFGIID